MAGAGRCNRRAAAFLGTAGALHAAYAVWGEKPWAREITKRLSLGKPLNLPHYLTIGFWYAAVGGAVLCLLAAAGLWWMRNRAAELPETTTWKAPSKRFLWGMIGVLAVALATRLPRMEHSFWNDEMKAMTMFVTGGLEEDDARRSYSDSWQKAIFGNPEANNHVLCTFESRIMHALWKATVSDGTKLFDEGWLRFPALMWGLMGIGLAGWLGRRLGGENLGLLFALLVTLHPWHIRFSTETRGYAAAMAGVMMLMLCLHGLLNGEHRRWQPWLGVIAALWVSMMANSACAPVLAGIMALAGGVLVRRRDWETLAWLFAANAAAATLFLDVYGPSLPQISTFLKDKAAGHLSPISLMWWQDVASAVVCGENWHMGYLGMKQLPLAMKLGLLGGFYGLLTLGLATIGRRGPGAMRVCAAAWLIAVTLVLVQNIVSTQAMLPWYLCPLLPGMVLCMAWGILKHPKLGGVLALVWIASLSPIVWQQVTRPRQPVRDAAGYIAKQWPGAAIAYFGISESFVSVYLPGTQILKRGQTESADVLQFKQWERSAAEAGLPFVVWYGGRQDQRSPELMSHFRSSGFTQPSEFHGADETYDVFVAMKPPPAAAAVK